MSKETGGPAFSCEYEGSTRTDAFGMTMRDYFAAKAMQGITSNIESYAVKEGETYADMVARQAYTFADSMLKEREK